MSLTFKSLSSLAVEPILNDDFTIPAYTPDGYRNLTLSSVQTYVNAPVLELIENLELSDGPSIWPQARRITLTGAATGYVELDGSEDVSFATAVDSSDITYTSETIPQSAVESLESRLGSIESDIESIGAGEGGFTAPISLLRGADDQQVLFKNSEGDEYGGLSSGEGFLSFDIWDAVDEPTERRRFRFDFNGSLVALDDSDAITHTYWNSVNLIPSTLSVASAAKWTTSRTLSLNGQLSGSVSWDGSTDAQITAVVLPYTVTPSPTAEGESAGFWTHLATYTLNQQGHHAASRIQLVGGADQVVRASVFAGVYHNVTERLVRLELESTDQGVDGAPVAADFQLVRTTTAGAYPAVYRLYMRQPEKFTVWRYMVSATAGQVLPQHLNLQPLLSSPAAGMMYQCVDRTFDYTELESAIEQETSDREDAINGLIDSISDVRAFVGHNYLINGDFEIWQRGTSLTNAVGYMADRWLSARSGSTYTLSRQAFTFGQTTVPGSPKYFMRMEVNSANTSVSHVTACQLIENVLTLQDEKVTASFWARADANRTVAIELAQGFGTGGSDQVTAGVQKIQLSTTWNRYTCTFDVPSVLGKTLGSGGNDYLGLFIWCDAGSTYDARTDGLGNQSGTFDFACVQLERGEHATDFEYLPLGQKLSLCQRYYSKSFHHDITPAGNFGTAVQENISIGTMYSLTNTNFDVIVNFPVEMRIVPTVTYYGIDHETFWSVYLGGSMSTNYSWVPLSVMLVNRPNKKKFSMRSVVPIVAERPETLAYGQSLQTNGHWTADAEIYG